jgi:predicted transcriptional regulator
LQAVAPSVIRAAVDRFVRRVEIVCLLLLSCIAIATHEVRHEVGNASFPPRRSRVARRSRKRAEGRSETLSAFVENSVRAQIEYRRTQDEFIARGLASLEDAKRTGNYHSSEDVLKMLKSKLDAARAAGRK